MARPSLEAAAAVQSSTSTRPGRFNLPGSDNCWNKAPSIGARTCQKGSAHSPSNRIPRVSLSTDRTFRRDGSLPAASTRANPSRAYEAKSQAKSFGMRRGQSPCQV